jgi:hypothetical protein
MEKTWKLVLVLLAAWIALRVVFPPDPFAGDPQIEVYQSGVLHGDDSIPTYSANVSFTMLNEGATSYMEMVTFLVLHTADTSPVMEDVEAAPPRTFRVFMFPGDRKDVTVTFNLTHLAPRIEKQLSGLETLICMRKMNGGLRLTGANGLTVWRIWDRWKAEGFPPARTYRS